MSLSAIQDNLLKTNLVQQTQTKGDDVVRGHQNAIAAVQKEDDRQHDQVVLSTRESEHGSVRDEEKEKGRNRDDGEEKERREKEEEEEEEEDNGPRARMRRINIII